MKLWSWGILAIALAVGGYSAFRTSTTPSDAASVVTAAAPPAADASLARVQSLERQVAEMNAQMQTRQAVNVSRSATTSPPPSADATENAQPSRELQAEAAQRFDAHAAQIAANFIAERRDQRWANDTGESLRTVLATGTLANVPVQSVDCRTSTCRVELQDDGSGMLMTAIPMLAVQMAAALPNVTAQRVDLGAGRSSMVLYMSR